MTTIYRWRTYTILKRLLVEWCKENIKVIDHRLVHMRRFYR